MILSERRAVPENDGSIMPAKAEAVVQRVLYGPLFRRVRRHIKVNHRVKIIEVDRWGDGLVVWKVG